MGECFHTHEQWGSQSYPGRGGVSGGSASVTNLSGYWGALWQETGISYDGMREARECYLCSGGTVAWLSFSPPPPPLSS